MNNSTPAIWQETIVDFPRSWQPPGRLSEIGIPAKIILIVASLIGC